MSAPRRMLGAMDKDAWARREAMYARAESVDLAAERYIGCTPEDKDGEAELASLGEESQDPGDWEPA